MKIILIAAALLWPFTLAWAGQPGPTPPNWGQADVSDWPCPQYYPSPTPSFVTMPLAVSLTTGGGPVLVSLVLNTAISNASSGVRTLVDVLVDGAPVGAMVDWHSFDLGPLESLTRILPVPSGAHTFGLAIACNAQGNTYTVERAWLSVYELPTIPK